MSAYRAYDNFRRDSSVYTWLYRIVWNAAGDYAAKQKKLPVVEYSESSGIPQDKVYAYINKFPEVEDDVMERMTKENCLQMFMNCLPAKYRAVFALRSILRCTVSETSEILGINPGAVKTNHHRARKLMKEQFEGRCSLIHPEAPCRCCSFAGFLKETGKRTGFQDIEVIKNKSRAAVEEYTDEMQNIFQIEELYDNEIKPREFDGFIGRIKDLSRGGASRLLSC
jgi:RNA polymerase sigma-70 factor (ECF subfamily)